MLAKKDVIRSIKSLPDKFSIDDAVENLILLNNIYKARKEIEEGKNFTTQQAKNKLKKWMK